MKKLDRTGWEVAILIAFVIALPLVEAPKNILWVIFVVTWFINRKATGDWGGKWDGWDTLFALWFGVYFVGTFFAGIHANEWRGLVDPLQYISLLWLIKRSNYQPKQYQQTIIAIGISVLIALGYGYWNLYVTHDTKHLELNSVGHFNHTAVYLVVTFGVLLSYTLSYWKTFRTRYKFIAIATLLILLTSIIISTSRAGVGATAVLVLLLAIAWWPRSKKIVATLVALIVVTSIALINFPPVVVQKHFNTIKRNHVLNTRDLIWSTGILAWREYPIFGIGAKNSILIDKEAIQAWAKKYYGEYDREKYIKDMKIVGHMHNLYVTTLVERGAIGLSTLLLVLSVLGWSLLKKRPKRGDNNLYWAIWGSAVSAWFTHVFIGSVNTTLHHEHALLAMLLIGLYLQYSHQIEKKNRILPDSSSVPWISMHSY